MTPEQLRKEAESTELLARVVSYAPDKARLAARAAELRRQADALERGAARPPGGPGARGADSRASA